MFKKSLYFDWCFLKIHSFSFSSRVLFVIRKYLAIVRLVIVGHSKLKFRNVRYYFESISEIGTFQSSIVDVYDELVATNLFRTVSPVIVDVGANTGQFASAAKLLFPNATVLSFEPDVTVFKKLVKNTEGLGVHAVNMGLSDKKDTLTFYQHEELSLISTFEKPEKVSDYRKQKLEVNSLDNLRPQYEELKKVNLLKIDVEGFETNVVLGAKKLLEVTDNILIEISLDRGSTVTNMDLLKTIYDLSNGKAKILKAGRELANDSGIAFCQDLLIRNR